MDFTLNEQQRLMQTSMREALRQETPVSLVKELEATGKSFHRPLWESMARMGWLGLGLPTDYGGEGGDAVDQGVLCAELGRVLAPSAYLSTIVPCAAIVAEAGTEDQKRGLLPEVIAGRRLLALALVEPDRSAFPNGVQATAVPDGTGFRLSGTKLFVYGGDDADSFLWVARLGGEGNGKGLGVFLVDARAPGVSVFPIETLSPEGQVEVTLADVLVPSEAALGDSEDMRPILERAVEHAALLKCVEIEAMGRVCLDMAVEYSHHRVQYGRPIGSFQVMQHRLVNVFMELEAASLAIWQGIWSLAQGEAGTEERQIAKVAAVQAADRVALETTAAHGGLGFMEKYDLQYYTRRMLTAAEYIGAGTVHREALADAMGL